LLDQRTKVVVKLFKGQQSGMPIESYGFDSAYAVSNFVLKEGALARVNGGTIFANVLEDQFGGVTSLHRFKNLWMAQRGTSIASETSEGNATFVDVFTGLESTEKMMSSQWRDRITLVNGVEAKFLLNRKMDSLDANYRTGNLGMDPPDYDGWNALTWNETSGEIANGTYYYVITVFDGETNSESPGCGSAVSVDGLFELSMNAGELNGTNFGVLGKEVVVDSAPSSITFDRDPLIAYLQSLQATNPRVTDFRVYRCQKDLDTQLYTTLFAVPNAQETTKPTIINIAEFISTTAPYTFIDNTATADLPAISPPDNNSPPPTMERLRVAREKMQVGVDSVVAPFEPSENSGFLHTKFFRDQLFGIGARSSGWDRTSVDFPVYNEVGRNNFSDILMGSEVYQPDYYPYIWEIARGDGQISTALGVLGDTALLVFKEKSTYYLTGSSPSDYILRVLDTNKGCVNASTVQETPIGVICLDRSGFVLFNKIGQGERISVQVQDVIDSIIFPRSETFYSFYDPKNQRYYCSVVVPGSETPNLTCCLDLDSMEWTFSEGMEGLSRLADTDSNAEYVELLGSKGTGRLVDLADPEIISFVGEPIYSSWTSGPIDFGDDQHKKKIRWLYLRAKANSNWTVTIEIIPDYDESRKYVVENFNVLSSQSLWYSSDLASDGTLIWDEGNWAFAGLERKIVKIPVVSKGYTFQVRIINQDVIENRWGFVIEGISAEADMLGK